MKTWGECLTIIIESFNLVWRKTIEVIHLLFQWFSCLNWSSWFFVSNNMWCCFSGCYDLLANARENTLKIKLSWSRYLNTVLSFTSIFFLLLVRLVIFNNDIQMFVIKTWTDESTIYFLFLPYVNDIENSKPLTRISLCDLLGRIYRYHDIISVENKENNDTSVFCIQNQIYTNDEMWLEQRYIEWWYRLCIHENKDDI